VPDLEEYRRKRDAGRTPEPVPDAGPLPTGDDDVFVIQEHHARRLHYDVRLERGGVLVSWAVPKGLPREPGTIRLAVHTEDHPMEYAGFEGDIPSGEYGAGNMRIWDRGRYETVKWRDDEVEVVLHGSQVDGAFVFFRKARQPGWTSGRDDKDEWMVRRKGERAKPAEPITVRVGDRHLRLTNLEKVLYPDDGFTKGQVIDYYRRVAPAILPHLTGRPVTFRRYPNGVDGNSFFEKDVSRHAPDWVRTVRLATPNSTKDGSETADYPLIDDLPTLIWAGNLAALELHVPQWTVGPKGGKHVPDLVVFDLDPGAPATVVECSRVAELINEVLREDGLTGFPKTSGSKGLQVYVPVRVSAAEQTSKYAKSVAARLAAEHPELVTAVMAKNRRTGKVFVDWDQNRPAKTTVAPYSLRARDLPTVSTPVTWDEIHACETAADLTFVADEVAERVAADGDPLADMHAHATALPR
jgi:DNA ligase D-like protein (predicted polymerase)/DNA ligase D-like protein (predicted 3'-phosphoesterase)